MTGFTAIGFGWYDPGHMLEMPLFPLNTVLFPGMPVHLHIFEERYKKMINLCIAEEKPFGIVLIKSGLEVGGGAPETHSVGCAAYIEQVQPLRDGRMDIAGIGRERIIIREYLHDRPYLVGKVEQLDFDPELNKDEKIKGWYLKKLLKNYLNVLATLGNMEVNLDELPKDPVELAYLATTLLQVPNLQKQPMLEINDGATLITKVYEKTRQEISILRNMLDPAISPNQDGPFSMN